MPNVAQLSTTLQDLFRDTATGFARRTGFIQRLRKVDGPTFVQTLVFGWLANPEASLEQLTQTAASVGLEITPQSLHERFGPPAAAFLEAVLAEATGRLFKGTRVGIELLERFTSIRLLDTSTIALPAALEALWPGCSGSTSKAGRAAVKIEVALDLVDGHLEGPLLLPGRRHDRKGQLAKDEIQPGALYINDLGYYWLDRFAETGQAGAFWLSRLKQATTLCDPDGTRFDVLDRLQATEAQGQCRLECAIVLGARHHLPARLLAQRVAESVANERRRKLRRKMQKQGRTPSKRTLALCSWTILVTNVPAEQLSFDEALALMRARWQIELVFKLWKQHGGIDKSRSQNPWRILCEVYAKLLAMVVKHWILLLRLWHIPDKSLVKASQTVSAHALAVAVALASWTRLCEALETLARVIEAGCRINPRRKHPNTYQRLMSPDICALS